MRYLLDTDTCIYLIKRSPPAMHRRFRLVQVGDVGVSAITCGELQFGVAKSTRPEQNGLALTEFLGPLEVLDFPVPAAARYGEVRAWLEAAGTPIGNYDLLIAAHALHLNLTLVTRNTREFQRIPGLRIDDWTSSAPSRPRP